MGTQIWHLVAFLLNLPVAVAFYSLLLLCFFSHLCLHLNGNWIGKLSYACYGSAQEAVKVYNGCLR